MRNTHGLDVMATSIEVRLSVPRTGNSGPNSYRFYLFFNKTIGF